MRLRLLVDWHGWRAGHVFTDYPRGAGRILCHNKVAEEEFDDSLPGEESDSGGSDPLPYASLTVALLREACRERGLPIYGTKATLVERLENADQVV